MIKFPYKLIELTHILTPECASWEGDCGFNHEVLLDYTDCSSESQFKVQAIKMYAGIGTHMDAPAHCIPGGKTIDELSLDELISPCVIIDVSSSANEAFLLSTDEIVSFENQYGAIKQGTFVIVYTGWSTYWNEPDKYRNNLRFPSVSKEAAILLIQRGIIGLGIDTLSPDTPESGYPVHQTVLGAGNYLIENIANAHTMPPIGAFLLALPILTKGGTEAPIRLIGLVPAASI